MNVQETSSFTLLGCRCFGKELRNTAPLPEICRHFGGDEKEAMKQSADKKQGKEREKNIKCGTIISVFP